MEGPVATEGVKKTRQWKLREIQWEIRYISRQPEKERLKVQLRANAYGMCAVQHPAGTSAFAVKKELSNQEAAVVRDRPADEAERSWSLRAGQRCRFDFVGTGVWRRRS